MEGIVRPRRGGLGGGPRAGLERESLRDKGPVGAQREGGNLKDPEGGREGEKDSEVQRIPCCRGEISRPHQN